MKAALALLCAPVLCAVLCSCAGGGKPAAGTGPYWPTRGWRTSDPRAQGMDGGMLERGISKILLDKRFPFNGMVVVRHGYIVKEVYFPPYDADTPHELYSCTKSFTSALVGIAIDAGFIKSAQEPALPLLPPRGGGAADRGLRSMTLKDLLTMSSGLQWTEDDSTLARLFMGRMGRDWVSYILNSPAAFAPGSGFLFSFGDSHLLSAIIQRSTGMKASQFARERLFRPLGITDVSWEEDPSGVTIGGWGLRLRPRDMAKFGYLYLREGEWEGKQVVSAGWVRDSARSRISAGEGVDYGYQWWIDPRIPGYAALGRQGQAIYVVPSLDLVVVFTGELPGAQPERGLMRDYIIPSCNGGNQT